MKWCPSDQFPVTVFLEFKRLQSKETPDPHFSSLKKKKKRKREGMLLNNNNETSKLSI